MRWACARAQWRQVESVLHQIELSQKSQSTRLGLNMASSLFPVWTHGGACLAACFGMHG